MSIIEPPSTTVNDRSGMVRLRSHVLVAAYRLAVPLAGAVPPHVAYPILDRLADLIRLAATDARQAVEDNLENVLGRRGRRHAWAVRGVFRHTMRNSRR